MASDPEPCSFCNQIHDQNEIGTFGGMRVLTCPNLPPKWMWTNGVVVELEED